MSEMAWVFKLIDQMSAPAKQMAAALGGVGLALKNVEQLAGSHVTRAMDQATSRGGLAAELRGLRTLRAEMQAVKNTAGASQIAGFMSTLRRDMYKLGSGGESLSHVRGVLGDLGKEFGAVGGASAKAFGAFELGLKKVVRRDTLAAQLRGLRALRAEFKAVGNAAGVSRVDAFTTALRRSNHATGALSRGLGTLRLRYASAGGGVSGFRSVLNGLSGPLGASISKTAALGAAALAATAALAAGGAAMAYVAGLQKVKESASLSFRTFLGTSEQASAMYKNVLDASKVFGTKPSDAIESFTELLGKGFKADEAFQVFQAGADLKALTPSVDLAGVMRAMGQIKGKGMLQMEELQQQLGEKFPVNKVLEQLADVVGASGATLADRVNNVRGMITAGKVDGQAGILGILRAVQDIGGGKPLGSLGAEKASTTLDGLMGKLKALPEQYILRMETSGTFASVTAGLDRFLKMLDPSTSLGKGITSMLEALLRLGVEIGGGFLDGLGEAFGPLKDLISLSGSGAGGPIAELGKGLRFVANGLGAITGFFLLGVGAIAGFVGAIGWLGVKLGETMMLIGLGVEEVLEWIGDFGSRAWAYCKEIGTSIVDGLWNGIKGAWTWLLEKFTGLIELLPDTVKTVLGISSPSRVMAKMGAHTTEGFARGLTSVDVAPAWNQALGVPKLPTASVVGGRAVSGGAPRSLSVGDVVINLPGQASDSAESIAKAVRRMFLTELGPALDQLAVEGGAF